MRNTRRVPEGLCALIFLWAQQPDISASRIRAHVKFLSSDLLEGRGPGGRGGQLATEYIATQFMLAGLKPGGDNGTYFQPGPLTGIQTEKSAQLSAAKRGRTIHFTRSHHL